MAALDKYLITKTEIQTYYPTAVLDDGRIKPCILEAQRMDLRPVLNDAFYYALMNDFNTTTGLNTTPAYETLRSGGTYAYSAQTIQFDGIIPMLTYFAIARFVERNPLHITRMGVTIKETDQSSPADARQIKELVNNLRSVAIMYQNQVIQYLEQNTTTFSLYNTGGGSDNAGRTTSFNSFKL